MVEFALVVPWLLLIVLGMADFGRALNYKNDLTQLANQSARYAAVNRDPSGDGSSFPSCSDLKTYLSDPANVGTKGMANRIESGVIEVSFGAQVGDPVTVKITVSFPYLGFIASDSSPWGLGTLSSDLTGKATMRLEQPPPYGSC